jgi:hypothetical protein
LRKIVTANNKAMQRRLIEGMDCHGAARLAMTEGVRASQ